MGEQQDNQSYYVVSRGGAYAAGSGWGRYSSLGEAVVRRDSLRASGVDVIITQPVSGQ